MNDEMKTTNETNEVARLRAEVQRAIEDRNRIGIEIRGEYLPKLKETNNEVARLRKYVELIEIFSPDNEWSQPEWRKLIGSKEENEDPETLFKLYEFRLAPAPKEPVIKESLTTEPAPEWRIKEKGEIIEAEDQYNSPMAGWVKAPWVGDKIETAGRIRTRRPLPDPVPTQPPTQNEWRDLGPDEEIHTGDEVQAKHHDKINGKWQAAWSFEIGVKAGHFKAMRYRTRRPLPKQEEERPLLKVMEYCRKWADEHLAGHGKETFYARLGLLVDFATDLHRDEIQKLKEAKP